MCKYNKSAPYSTVHDYQSRDLLLILEKPDLEYTRFYIYNNDEIKADKTAYETMLLSMSRFSLSVCVCA